MKRSFILVVFAFVLAAPPLQAQTNGPKRVTSADKVKATVTATKPDADGKQSLVITLEIEKNIILGANPVNHNHEFLDETKLTVKIAAKDKVRVDVKYPTGKTRRDGNDRYDVYEGNVRIDVEVVRTKGDTSPLDLSIRVHGWGLGY